MKDGKYQDAERGAGFSAGESLRKGMDSRVHMAVHRSLLLRWPIQGRFGFSSVRIDIALIP